MAHRDEELQVPEVITSCINNCGFPANPATKNMCNSCFKADNSMHIPSFSTASPSLRSTDSANGDRKEEETNRKLKRKDETVEVKLHLNRCFGCRKRVGLTGFRCRCGHLFCGEHRYSDRHDCDFDYKAAGRAAIAMQNPAVRAAKIVKI